MKIRSPSTPLLLLMLIQDTSGYNFTTLHSRTAPPSPSALPATPFPAVPATPPFALVAPRWPARSACGLPTHLQDSPWPARWRCVLV
ncbi:hypothetical protein B0H11DRAFT_2035191, partial [Mycena galericulata]